MNGGNKRINDRIYTDEAEQIEWGKERDRWLSLILNGKMLSIKSLGLTTGCTLC
jgi:hypothetical protein